MSAARSESAVCALVDDRHADQSFGRCGSVAPCDSLDGMGEVRAVHETARVARRPVTPAVGSLVVIGVWLLLLWAAQAHYAPLEAAHQAHLGTLTNPPILQDPPADVSRAEFFLGIVVVLALPVDAIAPLAGLSSARNSQGVTWVRALGWTTFGIGVLGATPALVAGFSGAVAAFFNALTLVG